ncbi:hypothetical protein PPL_03467 [Heterostelium album PN500]|uniref:Uncharacterized protein n=1 Tax=Heterostelium pallidum (strain ATCC 26659 / Pp 5 / PN500) TaxID=670386 RepID=D3B4Z1_HETP5|nr:hypothetical protein PPL_03467 [Heterostelium album PN500]EFA84389.1 hypothetical protein PPL_03467 [Heterostelium album PN500]|eukprot:XP_020436503.1 hypothetical protein PPL_03467 [Heterostelium album PN500]
MIRSLGHNNEHIKEIYIRLSVQLLLLKSTNQQHRHDLFVVDDNDIIRQSINQSISMLIKYNLQQ